MKKKLFNLIALFAMMLAVGSMAVSCTGNDGVDNGDGGKDDNQIEQGVNPTEKYDVPTPIAVKSMKAEATSPNGVTIEVTGVSANTFVMDLTPGSGIQSYRLDCYPLAHLYNSLFEQMKTNGKTELTEEEVNGYIRDMIFNGTGSGGYTISPDMHEDYAKKTLDWGNSAYSQFAVVPGAEYVIITIGCFDQNGSEAAEMTLCYVATPEEAMVGNPDITIDTFSTYAGWRVTYVDNEDCHYISNWETDKSDFMPYIEAYGEAIFIDWLRHTYQSGPQNVAAWEANYGTDYYVERTGFNGVDPTHEFMACAVAMDVNGTAAKQYRSAVFTLKEKPETDDAEARLTINQDMVGSQSFEFTWYLDKASYAGVFQILTEAEYESSWKNMTDEELAAMGATVYANGLGMNNYNYMWDEELGEPVGDSYEGSSVMSGCRPGETYILAYTARNAVGDYMPVKFTEPVTMKNLTLDTPEASKADCVGTLTAEGRNLINVNFSYTLENTAVIHWQIIEPFNETNTDYPSPEQYDDRDFMLNFLLETGSLGNFNSPGGMICNHFQAYENDSMKTGLAGMESGKKHVVAYVAEDWDGVVGEVQFAECTTEGTTTGGNPVITITPTEASDGSPSVEIRMNSDVKEMYLTVQGLDNADLYLEDLYEGKRTQQFYLNRWNDYVSQYGLKFESSAKPEMMKQYFNDIFMVVLATGFGYDANGAEVWAEMQYLIYDATGAEPVFRTIDYYVSE